MWALIGIPYNRHLCWLFSFREMGEVKLKDLLCECSKKTGYDKATVEKIVGCFLNTIIRKLSKDCEVDLGDDFGVLIAEEKSENLRETFSSISEVGRYKVIFKEGSELEHRQKSQLVSNNFSWIGLLETLQFQIGCVYLSDLHIPSNLPLIRCALRKIDPDSYCLREWNDAVCYITGKKSNFQNPREAAKYLMECI